ncbi:patatin-like phospholipase family protein [Moraxella bovoculi]|uniref:patatin-like phospholipase family protein n=1 Tax=Moraxella bovoculi TaxID=386891 RepID=UPI0009BADB2C|nr:patatin-like phospholipase family protein [Moraxella bovoculi]
MKKTLLIGASLSTALIAGCAAQHTQQAQHTPTVHDTAPDVALVLGGGGTRGYAHIGAIKALEEHGIRPDLIVGTSAGAMVGALSASGKSAKELERIAMALDEADLLDIALSKQGLIEGKALRDFINTQVNNKPIESLPTRFAAIATDAHANTTVSFRQGDTGLAVQASSSIPKLFIAPRVPEIGGKKYIDGGQSAVLPSAAAKSMGAQFVIAVDVMSASNTQPADKPANSQGTAGISRTDKGIKAVWGDEVIEFPINSDIIKQSTKDLPVSIDVEKLLGMIPNNTQIPLPKGFPTSLPKSKDDIMQAANTIFMQNQRHAKPADVKASDVIIAPDLSKYAVFDGSAKEEIIQAGYDAAIAKIPQIKQALAEHQKLQSTTKQ